MLHAARLVILFFSYIYFHSFLFQSFVLFIFFIIVCLYAITFLYYYSTWLQYQNFKSFSWVSAWFFGLLERMGIHFMNIWLYWLTIIFNWKTGGFNCILQGKSWLVAGAPVGARSDEFGWICGWKLITVLLPSTNCLISKQNDWRLNKINLLPALLRKKKQSNKLIVW